MLISKQVGIVNGYLVILETNLGTLTSFLKTVTYSGFIFFSIDLLGIYVEMAVTPNKQKVLVQSSPGTVKVLSLPGLVLLHTHTPAYWTTNLPKQITFSADSSLAVVEVGHIIPVVLLNLTDYSIAHEIPTTELIESAHFINSGN